MSKMLINILDKFVWMLVITVITTQALQIVGVVEGPTKLDKISYPEPHEYEFKIMSEDSREKRQTQERLEVLDNIFNIPIATLNSVNELLQSTRRLRLTNLENRRRLQEQLLQQQQLQLQQQQTQQEQQDQIRKRTNKRQRYNAYVQADGSSSRVLLNV